jgi:hypothetical protein
MFDHFFLQGGKAEQESLQVLHIPFFVLIILAMALICFKRRNTLKNKKGNTGCCFTVCDANFKFLTSLFTWFQHQH